MGPLSKLNQLQKRTGFAPFPRRVRVKPETDDEMSIARRIDHQFVDEDYEGWHFAIHPAPTAAPAEPSTD